MAHIEYRELDAGGRYYGALAVLGAMVLAGLTAAWYMEHHGHVVTGMNNQIVWGMPHVFAVFLIVAASGALNVASIASVFGRAIYKPLARLSALLAMALLMGGLAVLVLDLGRPDRLIVAMTHYNFKSIFAWNIFLYTGFLGIVAVYLWFMMERRMQRYSKPVGLAAFVWRLILTTGTGSIFGFLVARDTYDEAIMAPLFIALSLSLGLAAFVLVLMAVSRAADRTLGDALLARMRNLLGVLVAAVLYFVLAYHLTKLYATRYHGVEAYVLTGSDIHTLLFWFGAVLMGGVLPLALMYLPAFRQSRAALAAGAVAVLLGGLSLVYVIIIGGQAWPLNLFPGMQVSSSFYDGDIHGYAPSTPEILLGLGGVALALLITVLALRLLRILPASLADADVDPHSRAVPPAAAAA